MGWGRRTRYFLRATSPALPDTFCGTLRDGEPLDLSCTVAETLGRSPRLTPSRALTF